MVRRQPNISGQHTVHGRASRHAWTIAALYAAIAILWLVSSDHLLNLLVYEESIYRVAQTFKGSLFVFTTTLVIYFLVYRRMSLLLSSHDSLSETHAHLRAIFEASPLAIYTISPQGKIGLWNATAHRMFGWSQSEVSGNAFPGVPEDQLIEFTAMRQQVLSGQQLRDHIAKRVCKDGKVIDVNISTAPLYGRKGKVVDTMVMIADVTEQRRTMNIERERDSLRTTARAMEDALGVVGHELRTPLASLHAISEVLLTENIHELDERNRLVQSINDETIRLSGMVSNMLEAARLNSGVAKWEWSVVDMGVICRDTLDIIRPLTDTALVKLSTNAEAGRYIMNGDEDAIRRLLVNLTSNAQKNTRRGSIDIQIRSMYDSDGRWLIISVADTGRGISQTVCSGLGRAFALNQGAITAGPDSLGAGLGLAICRGIVAAHGGKLAVSSMPGKGTTFTVALRSNLLEPVITNHELHIIHQVAKTASIIT